MKYQMLKYLLLGSNKIKVSHLNVCKSKGAREGIKRAARTSVKEIKKTASNNLQ